MDLPVMPPLRPMLAKSVKGVPAADSVAGGLVIALGFAVVSVWMAVRGSLRPSRTTVRANRA